MTIVHACCVALGETGILIRGPSGAGKSDLTLRLIDAGADLVADDYCEVTADAGILKARAPDSIAGKLEIRGYGILTMPYVSDISVCLIVELSDKNSIERMPENTACVLDGIKVPCAWIDPASPSAAARVRVIASTINSAVSCKTERT